jgi:prevent-host-death family protein
VVRRAESGEEIQITRRGVPVAVLRAVSSSDQERIERFRALVDRARAGANDEDEDDPWANLRDESHGRPPPSFE